MSRQFAALPLAAFLLLGPGAAFAQVVTPARDSIATISFADLSFRDAKVQLSSTQTIAAGSAGTSNVIFDAFRSLEGYSLSSTGNVGVAVNSFTPPASFNVAVSATGAGSWTINERFATSDDPFGDGPLYRYIGGNDVFVPFTNNTLPAIELTLFIGSLVDVGGSFGIGFTIPGNWSTTGGLSSMSGQYFLANLEPAWTIDTNFVYDPVAKVTRFHATNPSYGGVSSDQPSPFLDVYFLGAVPEPATWTTMILGFGAIAAALRCHRRVGNAVRFA